MTTEEEDAKKQTVVDEANKKLKDVKEKVDYHHSKEEDEQIEYKQRAKQEADDSKKKLDDAKAKLDEAEEFAK